MLLGGHFSGGVKLGEELLVEFGLAYAAGGVDRHLELLTADVGVGVFKLQEVLIHVGRSALLFDGHHVFHLDGGTDLLTDHHLLAGFTQGIDVQFGGVGDLVFHRAGLGEGYVQDVGFFDLAFGNVFGLTGGLQHPVDLLVDELIRGSQDVLVEGFLRQLQGELGLQRQVVLKSNVLQAVGRQHRHILVLNGLGAEDEFDVVLLDVAEEAVFDHRVQFLAQDLVAHHFAQGGDGGFALAETLHAHFLLLLLKFGNDLLVQFVLGDGQGETTGYVACLFKCYVRHCLLIGPHVPWGRIKKARR